MAQENLKSYLTGISHSVASMLAASSHTLCLLMSKHRSSLEAGKKQPRVWLEYACSVTEVLLYPSFRVPLVLLLSPYGDSEMVRNRFEGQRSRQHLFKCLRSGLHSLTNPCPLADELMFLF